MGLTSLISRHNVRASEAPIGHRVIVFTMIAPPYVVTNNRVKHIGPIGHEPIIYEIDRRALTLSALSPRRSWLHRRLALV